MTTQFLKFTLLGLVTAAIEVGLFQLFYALSTGALWSSVLATLLSTLINYWGSRALVFVSEQAGRLREVSAFALLSAASFLLNQLIFYVALTWLMPSQPVVVKIIAVGAVAVGNFFAKKYWVFSA